MKISIDNNDYTMHELREWAMIALGGFAGLAFSAILDHIEAQQGERQAFVWGANWAFLECNLPMLQKGWDDATAEAAKRYPAARPMPTREMVATVIDRCVFYDPDTRGGVGGADEAVSEIMRLIGGQNGD